MVLLYAVSAVYHIGEWREPVRRLLARLDYANIFLFIAASHTVLSVLAVPREGRLPGLALVWFLGAAGAGCAIALPARLRRARTALCVAVAWAGLFQAPVPHAALAPPASLALCASAMAYLAGGAVYAWRRPNPLPAVFGFHELFHLLTILANAALAAAIWARLQ
jgi:hemolysin III